MNGDEKLAYEVIIPRIEKLDTELKQNLRDISTKLDRKIDRREMDSLVKEVEELREEMDELQKAAISPSQVRELIGQSLNTAEARGWSTTEIRVAQIGAVVLAAGLFLQVFQVFFK